jgi:predicted nucleic acid-binding protein
VTLVDAGPLIALIDAGEPDHERCRAALDELRLPLVTTWPAFTETIYLLGRAAGWQGQHALWRMVERGALRMENLSEEMTLRSAELMERYRDHPMDLADATLVALAEAKSFRLIVTLDSDFRSYRLRGGGHLELVPA